VFVGAATDRRIRAFDSKTGKEIVAVVATDSLVAFTLPQ
jgi:hypothetical protein